MALLALSFMISVVASFCWQSVDPVTICTVEYFLCFKDKLSSTSLTASNLTPDMELTSSSVGFK